MRDFLIFLIPTPDGTALSGDLNPVTQPALSVFPRAVGYTAFPPTVTHAAEARTTFDHLTVY